MAAAQSQFEVAGGYVYILSCSEEPDSIKIGSTSGEPGAWRNEPFGTSYPIPCKVEFALHVPDPETFEQTLRQKLAPRRLPRDRERFSATPDEAVSAAVQLVGYGYTNAQVTGVIFRKQVDMIKKMEADFRSRNKSFSILNGELAELQKKVRRYKQDFAARKAAVETQQAQIAALQGENLTLSAQARRNRQAARIAGGIALVAALIATAQLTGIF